MKEKKMPVRYDRHPCQIIDESAWAGFSNSSNIFPFILSKTTNLLRANRIYAIKLTGN